MSAASGSSGATSSGTVSANADGTDLSPEEADAQLSSQTVKPYVTLGNGGGNFHSWNKMLKTQARAKRCHMALVKDYPDTAMDAATQLLMSSISTTFQQTVSCYPAAHRGYRHILDKFTGGKN